MIEQSISSKSPTASKGEGREVFDLLTSYAKVRLGFENVETAELPFS